MIAICAALVLLSDPAGLAAELDETCEVVAGGAGDAFQVTYLRLAGSDRAIGRRLAEIAHAEHGSGPLEADPLVTRAQRAYFERYFPAHVERMRGVADAFGVDFDAATSNVSKLHFGFGRPGCTVAYYPPELCADGGGLLSRNFDFTTGTWAGRLPQEPGDERVCGRPYVMELWPDGGYASIAVCAYDLLGGVVDGMNSEGLAVALLADDEVMERWDLEGARGPRPGFDVIQIGRFLLETCATAEEARVALLEAKLYHHEVPCHYVIADASGDSFVWENAVGLTHGYVIEREPGQPLVSTNFMHHLHPEEELPDELHPNGSFNRHRAIQACVDAAPGPVTLEFVKRTAESVAQTSAAPAAPIAPGRTLWHAIYAPSEGRVEIDFYLGESGDEIRRSGYLAFELAAQGEERSTAAR